MNPIKARLRAWGQTLILRLPFFLGAPRYQEQLPVDEPGEWVAVAILFTEFRSWEKASLPVTGLRNAYREARWLAWKLDWRTREYSHAAGVRWAVRKPIVEEKSNAEDKREPAD